LNNSNNLYLSRPLEKDMKYLFFSLYLIFTSHFCAATLLSTEQHSPVEFNLINEEKTIQQGHPFWVIAHVQLQEGWHASWQNEGEEEPLLQLEWKLPSGYTATSVQWPAPERFTLDSLSNLGYEKEIIVLAQVIPPSSISENEIHIQAQLSWLTCSDSQCIPGTSQASLALPVISEAPLVNETHIALFQKARAQEFWQANDQNISMEDLLSPTSSKPIEAEKTLFSAILFFAFIGGLILNCMPCVLPVVSLKILSFINMARQKRSLIFKHSISFSLGVLISFWILAGALIIMQIYGRSVGWGFQLQEPLFVAFLAAIVWILGLNLFGVFEAGTSLASLAGNAQNQVVTDRSGYLKSFLSGTFATAVATPCTGPFLGPVVGFAVAATPMEAFLTFSSMALGMSFPYLFIAAFPRFLKFLPKPGRWMETFKQLMGFLMVSTTLWLIWIFGAQTGSTAIVILLGALFFLSIGVWVYGKWGSRIHKTHTRLLSGGVALICICMGTYTLLLAERMGNEFSEGSNSAITATADGWEPFSPQRLASLREQGIPVFIDFTAKWCLICQVNHAVLGGSDLERQFADHNVVKMKADWTKNDPTITQELRKHGRSGVPLYLLYSGHSEASPVILPQVLTSENVGNALELIK
jgi:thiol:disulfide interchange protein